MKRKLKLSRYRDIRRMVEPSPSHVHIRVTKRNRLFFEALTTMMEELGISLSEFFLMAAKDYVRRMSKEHRELFDRIRQEIYTVFGEEKASELLVEFMDEPIGVQKFEVPIGETDGL